MDWFAVGAFVVIATALGLLAIGLTIEVLWRKGWARVWAHLAGTAELYFRRIRWFGHTYKSTWTAVACGLSVWLGITAAFIVTPRWEICVLAFLAIAVAFLSVAWRLRGPRAPDHPFRFVCSFFEPALALAVPSLLGKVFEASLKSLAAGF
jgi:hypothetical protein